MKDSDYDNGISQSTHGNLDQNFVEIHLTTGSNNNIFSRSYDAMDKDTTVTFVPVNITSGPVSQDLTITFDTLNTAKNAIVDSLVNKEGFLLAPVSKYTLVDGLKVVIPKGQSTGYIKIKFNPTNFVGDMYVFGFELKSVSDSKYKLSNLATGIIKFGIKNQYDGMYESKGYFIHPSLGKSTFDYTGAGAEPLSTIGATANEMPWAGDRAIAVDLTVTTDVVVVNGKNMFKVSIFIPAYSGNSGQSDVDDTGNTMNYYNPETRTYELLYWYNKAAHRTIRETLIYEGPR